MNRNAGPFAALRAGSGTRNATAILTLALAVGACAQSKPGADSAEQARTDQPAETPATGAQKARADSQQNAAQATTAGVSTKTAGTKSESTASKTKIIGRDSVRQGPIIGVPTIVDTAKRRPPR